MVFEALGTMINSMDFFGFGIGLVMLGFSYAIAASLTTNKPAMFPYTFAFFCWLFSLLIQNNWLLIIVAAFTTILALLSNPEDED